MRENTWNKMARKVDDFIHKLGSQLVEGLEPSELRNEELLKNALEESIKHLPSGYIKTKLEKDFDKYYEKLKRYLEKSLPLSEKTEQLSSNWTFNILDHNGVRTILEDILRVENYKEKTDMYIKLILCCKCSGIDFSEVLTQWSEELELCEIQDNLEAVELCSRITCSCSLDVLLTGLKFSLQIFTSLLQKGKERELLLIQKSIFQILSTHHFQFHSKRVDESVSRCYGDVMSALASLYIEVCIMLREPTYDHIERILLVLFGNSTTLLLDTLLQVTLPQDFIPHDCVPHEFTLFLPVVTHILEYIFNNHSTEISHPSPYLKSLCCLNYVHLLSDKETQYQTLKIQFHKIINISVDLNDWMWFKNPRLCKQLGLKRKWSNDKLNKFLLNRLNKDQLDILLDLVSGCGLLSDTTLSEPPHLDEDDTVEVIDTQSPPLFFVDNEGFKEDEMEGRNSEEKEDTNKNYSFELIHSDGTNLPLPIDMDGAYMDTTGTNHMSRIVNDEKIHERIWKGDEFEEERQEIMEAKAKQNPVQLVLPCIINDDESFDKETEVTTPFITRSKKTVTKVISPMKSNESFSNVSINGDCSTLITTPSTQVISNPTTSSSKKRKALLLAMSKSKRTKKTRRSLTPSKLPKISPKFLRSSARKKGIVLDKLGNVIH